MNFGIEDINVNNLEKVIDGFGAKSPMCRELAAFASAALTELQKLADDIKKRKKLKIED